MGVNISLIFLPKQLRLYVSFAGTWLSHLGVLRRLHTKLWYTLNWSMQHLYIWSPYCKTQIQQVEKVQRTAARWTCRRWRNTSSVGEMLDELQWPTLEARMDQSPLLFFPKIHCGTMSIDTDKYLTPSQSTRSTGSSHNSQYCRPQTKSDALECSFFPRIFPNGIVWFHLWSFFLCILPDPISSITCIGRCTLYTPGCRMKAYK